MPALQHFGHSCHSWGPLDCPCDLTFSFPTVEWHHLSSAFYQKVGFSFFLLLARTGLSASRPHVVVKLQRGEEPWVPSGMAMTSARNTQRRPSPSEWGLKVGLLRTGDKHLSSHSGYPDVTSFLPLTLLPLLPSSAPSRAVGMECLYEDSPIVSMSHSHVGP